MMVLIDGVPYFIPDGPEPVEDSPLAMLVLAIVVIVCFYFISQGT